MTEALVLGGGGVGGIAWMTGLLAGLAQAGQDVTGADLVVGTSAGSVVAAQLGSGLPLDQLYARQVDPALQSEEIMAEMDVDRFAAELGEVLGQAADAGEVRRAIGRMALRTETVPEPKRRAVIASRLPSHAWPARPLRIVAVDAATGAPRVFDNTCGVDLVEAVAASCAVPCVWPPVSIDGSRYVDGGIRSMANADYAAGASRVLVVVPMGTVEMLPGDKPLEEALEELRASGAEVAVIEPDEGSRTAIGANPLDPATRVPAAEAGRRQGRRTTVEWKASHRTSE
ncbi:patatin-like phospholipase family protein [Streptomyces sp. NPDC048664]|uniref:patatin-like phospholipase family protein n=1 Tax=Streptomyces sp. NPDC048664 TaxID=3154505 RepID=UPI0034421C66